MSILSKLSNFIKTPLNLDSNIDNFDGRYQYDEPLLPIPNIIRRLMGMPELKPDRRKKRFGRIRKNPFYYITIPMIFVAFLVAYTAIMAFENLVVYFNTNVYLNALIISFMIFGILKVFHNNFMLYESAQFFMKLEDVVRKDQITDEDIFALRRLLEKKGELVNTIYMSETIDNVKQFGHPNFNSMRARLIKSKLGFRISKNKSNVNFIAGILVMLGLLGTFLGLLGTIDAVGQAMNSMSNIGGESGEIGMEEMTGFIGSLAAPLNGMGLAFSSSLFGLSGSLLIGFFLHLGGTPQNEFIENVSRWIDDREVKFDPNVKKGSKAKVPPEDADLKEWLSGFIHMSVRTNKTISLLSNSVEKATHETNRAWMEVKGLSDAQLILNDSTRVMIANLQDIRDQGQVVAQAVPKIAASVEDTHHEVANKMEDLEKQATSIAVSLPKITENIEKSQISLGTKIDKISNDASFFASAIKENNRLFQEYAAFEKNESSVSHSLTNELKLLIVETNKILNEVVHLNKETNSEKSLELFTQALNNLDNKQTELMMETRNLLSRLQQDPNMKQAQSLVNQLNSLLNNLNKKTKSLFSSKEK